MKRITDFIIDKRYFILIIFIILSAISIFWSSKVKINSDITKYLPNTSETRLGKDIMENEFPDAENSSSFNLMFKGLTNEDKSKIYDDLVNTNNVASVSHDDTENYNKEDYTLYVIHVDEYKKSEIAKKVYKEILEKYEDYEIYTSGEIVTGNTAILPTWILAVAIIGATIILIIMSESYVEPFLFLASIFMAVILNNGTNIIFDSVSSITNAIAAILQMALSMDYSIMLMNRFRQEKEHTSKKEEAMKNALYNSFKSISSSSVTTIVGLITLVFMSFTIGRDLGLVLAKGVLLSLVTVFFVLPTLILVFDKQITKTKKKSFNLKLDKLGKISYKIRYPITLLFVIAFVGSFLLKGNMGFLYTASESNKISDIFGKNNQIAVIYKNKEEEKVGKYLKEIENQENVDSVLAYSNTINEKLEFDELKENLKSIDSEMSVEDYLLKILYYKYYHQNEDNQLTFGELSDFIQTEVWENEDIASALNDDMKEEINKLEYFSKKDEIEKKRNSSEISNILGIGKEDIEDIFIYYHSKNNNLQITINEFVNFMNKDVLTNSKYSKSIDENTKSRLQELAKFSDKNTIQTKMSSKEMADFLGIDESTMNDLYTYYISLNDIDIKLTLSEFANFVITDIFTNQDYANNFDENTVNSIKTLDTFSDTDTITKDMNFNEIATLFGIDTNSVNGILFLKYMNSDNGSKLSIPVFVNSSIDIKNNTNYLDGIDISVLEKLSIFTKNEGNILTTKMNQVYLSNLFDNISQGLVNNIYLFTGLPDDYLMTPQEFLGFVLNTLTSNISDESLDIPAMSLDENTLNNLKLLKVVIDESVSTNPEQYTAAQLSKILGINENQMCNLYALIDFSKGNIGNWSVTPNEFVNLILTNSNNDMIKASVNEDLLNKLKLLSNIMESSINKTTYSYKELADFIGIDENSIKSIYSVYVSKNSTLRLTPIEIVSFILNHQEDGILARNLNRSILSNLKLLQTVMESIINNTKYNSLNLSSLLGINKESLDLVYGLYVSRYINTNQSMSLKGFIEFVLEDVMNHPDYSSNFDEKSRLQLKTIKAVMNASLNDLKYSKDEMFYILSDLSDSLDKDTIEILYLYYGSAKEYNSTWTMTIEEFVKFLNEDILNDDRFTDFINDDTRKNMIDSKETIKDVKKLLVGNEYSRIIINTSLELENEETFHFIQDIKDMLKGENNEIYVIGDSAMAYEMNDSFGKEFNFISILTMVAIYVVVAITFKSAIIPLILVLIVQCAVYMTMGILSFTEGSVYFIAILIVQSILMGATIDYAIVYTSYYLEHRKTNNIKEAMIKAYNSSIHTILTSSSILIIVTFIIGKFAKDDITSMICITLSKGTLCSALLILLLLPSVLTSCDKLIAKKK